MLRSRIFIDCDGGCGTTAEMDGSTTQPLVTLVDAGWTVPVNRQRVGEVIDGQALVETVQKHYCPMCTRARLTGTI